MSQNDLNKGGDRKGANVANDDGHEMGVRGFRSTSWSNGSPSPKKPPPAAEQWFTA